VKRDPKEQLSDLSRGTEMHDWNQLNHIQIGRYAEYCFKMRFVLLGLDVYSAEVDDRGIDFAVRQEPDLYWDIQVKSSRQAKSGRGFNYVFVKRRNFRIRPNLLVGLALFEIDREPALFLIPATRWKTPGGIFVDRSYKGRKSEPEYGLKLSRKWISELDPFRFDTKAASHLRLTAPHRIAGRLKRADDARETLGQPSGDERAAPVQAPPRRA
jgi:hypothetical protein